MKQNYKDYMITLICFTLIGVLLLFIPLALFPIALKENCEYHEVPAVVEEVTADCVVLVDNDGEAWVFEGDGYEVGQLVIVVFDDMGTNDIYDDEIIEIRG